jgi:hypothetical protein
MMRDLARLQSVVKMSTDDPVDIYDSKFVWGARAIGKVIDRSERQVHYLLASGTLKSAQKKGGRWVANRPALIREFGA